MCSADRFRKRVGNEKVPWGGAMEAIVENLVLPTEDGNVSVIDVLIIGAGWSGLLACKYCLGEGLSTLVLESRDSIGGVWSFTTDRRFGGVMTTTETTSSRCITEISDFPMPEDYPDFPSHKEILTYLNDFCLHFDLYPHIRFGERVTELQKVGDAWHVRSAARAHYRAKHLIICSGVHQHPNDLSSDRRFINFAGDVLHSAAVKEIPPDYAGKTFIVWGGGESASDIALELSRSAERVYWCIPNGQWFVPKVVKNWPPFSSRRRKVVDHTSSRLRLLLSPTHGLSPFINQYLQWAFGFNGHGQPAWKTEAPYNRSFFNKSSEVLAKVKSGNVIPKRDIAHCYGNRVTFTDGEEVRADIIVTCSGYRLVLPFFNGAESPSTDPRDWYKYLFPDASLALIGYVRPIFGSIPGIAELQSRYAALVFAGKRSLPDRAERARIIRRDSAFWNHHFRFTSLRLGGLVDHFLYCDQIARLIGCRPRFWKLLFMNPSKWWWAVSSPWNGCHCWLNDASHHERVFNTFARYRDNQSSEVYTFLVLAPLLPIIGLCSRVRLFLREHLGGGRSRNRLLSQVVVRRMPDESIAD
jgi:dimethylaniline monooxygenase (N-oxide forming)